MRFRHDLIDLVLNVIAAVNGFTGGVRGMMIALIVLGLLWLSNFDDEPEPVTTRDRLETYIEFMNYCDDRGLWFDECQSFWENENYD